MRAPRPVWLGEDKHQWDHVRVHLQLIEDPRLGPFEISTWLAIAYRANIKTGNAIWSQADLAALAKCSQRRLRDALTKLVDCGYLTIVDRHNGEAAQYNQYNLLSPPSRQELSEMVPAGDAGVPAGDAGVPAGDAGAFLYKQDSVTRLSNKMFVQTDESDLHRPLFGDASKPEEGWPEEINDIPQILEEIDAPPGFADPAFWKRIDTWIGPHPTVGYVDELRRWVTWWHTMPPSRRRKAVQRSFTTWLRTEEARANNAAARANNAAGEESSKW